jgi:hypothetical protein
VGLRASPDTLVKRKIPVPADNLTPNIGSPVTILNELRWPVLCKYINVPRYFKDFLSAFQWNKRNVCDGGKQVTNTLFNVMNLFHKIFWELTCKLFYVRCIY